MHNVKGANIICLVIAISQFKGLKSREGTSFPAGCPNVGRGRRLCSLFSAEYLLYLYHFPVSGD